MFGTHYELCSADHLVTIKLRSPKVQNGWTAGDGACLGETTPEVPHKSKTLQAEKQQCSQGQRILQGFLEFQKAHT